MVQVFSLSFLIVWILGAAAMWTLTVTDTQTGIQFAYLNVPPTILLLASVLFAHKLAE